MPQVKPIYEEVDEFNDIAKQLIEKYPDVFPGVDADMFVDNIKCVAITNKDRREGKDYAKIEGITDPARMFSEVAYIVTVYQKDWIEMSDTHKSYLVMKQLRRIPLDEDSEGKLTTHDFKDDGMMVRTLGPDYMENFDGPDLLDESVEWVVEL